eukprot:TRINITY_DN24434_c0_g1_i1.p1 TRINITY_DN24434_c0_g1~~TRINITY_DN24434_c0_g1_i1.p1  ORF type:complete len:510 (+),score=55.11 TRINITY_DN24434_c0_g1_i1:124-1530(+)
MGGIDEVTASSQDGSECSFIVKVIGVPQDLENHELRRDHTSYFVEASFYERGHAQRLCSLGALCPRPLLVDKQSGILRICMTRLPGAVFDGEVTSQVEAALQWLARLHATYWGTARADKAVSTGLQVQGCYWHFDTRHKELSEMSAEGIDARHKLCARGLDARLKADCMQTICHGDAKGANIMFDPEAGISLFDFQWTGKAPPTKDLAYFISCAVIDADETSEDAYLRYYHGKLSELLEAQGDTPPTFDLLRESYILACVDLARWMAGWSYWGNKQLLKGHVVALLDRLDEGKALDSESAYQDKIFALYPPGKLPSASSLRGNPKCKSKVSQTSLGLSGTARIGARSTGSNSGTSRRTIKDETANESRSSTTSNRFRERGRRSFNGFQQFTSWSAARIMVGVQLDLVFDRNRQSLYVHVRRIDLQGVNSTTQGIIGEDRRVSGSQTYAEAPLWFALSRRVVRNRSFAR